MTEEIRIAINITITEGNFNWALYSAIGDITEENRFKGSAYITRTLAAGTYYMQFISVDSDSVYYTIIFTDESNTPIDESNIPLVAQETGFSSSYSLDVTPLPTLSHVASARDTTSLNLDGADSITTAVVEGVTYLFASGYNDDGVNAFRVNANGSLAHVDSEKEISGARGLDTAVIDGTTYLYVTAGDTGGVAVFSVNNGGRLTSVGTSVINHLEGSATSLITVKVGSNTYGYVTSAMNGRLASILLSGSFPFVEVISEQLLSDNFSNMLSGTKVLTTAAVGDKTYLYMASEKDGLVTIFQVPSDSSQVLTKVGSYRNSSTVELNATYSATSAYIRGIPYLFVAGNVDDGVSIFRINNNGTLIRVSQITDISSRSLNEAVAVTTAVVSGNTYLFVGGYDGVSVFRISSTGSWAHATSIYDIQSSSYELNGVLDITTAVVDGNLYLFAAGDLDDGLSVFRVDP